MRCRTPSFPKMRARCPSTVRSERNSAAATSRFVLPSATRAATRSSAGVSAPGVAARPLIRFSSARVRSAQSAAPIRSKTASASSSVARASRRRFSRRWAAPRASRARPRSSGVDLRVPARGPPRSSAARLVEAPPGRREQAAAAASSWRAPIRVRADARSPRTSRAARAPRRLPASTSASIGSGRNGSAPGSSMSSRRMPLDERCRASAVAAQDRRARARGGPAPTCEDPGRNPTRRLRELERPHGGRPRGLDMPEWASASARTASVYAKSARWPDCSATAPPVPPRVCASAKRPRAHSTWPSMTSDVRERAFVPELLARRTPWLRMRRSAPSRSSCQKRTHVAANDRLAEDRTVDARVLERERPLGGRRRAARPSAASADSAFVPSASAASCVVAELFASATRPLRETSTASSRRSRSPEGRAAAPFVRDASTSDPVARPPRSACAKSSEASAGRRRTSGMRASATSSAARAGPGRRASITARRARLARARVAGLEVQVGGLDRASAASLRRSAGVSCSARSRRSAAGRGAPRSAHAPQRLSSTTATASSGSVDRGRQLPRACLGILEQLGEASVDLDAPKREAASRRHPRRAVDA